MENSRLAYTTLQGQYHMAQYIIPDEARPSLQAYISRKEEKIKAVGVLLNTEKTTSLWSAAWEREFVGEWIAFMSRE